MYYDFLPPLQCSPSDAQYFDKDFTMEKPRLTKLDNRLIDTIDKRTFKNFSFTMFPEAQAQAQASFR
jgi:hypothetical protein